MAAALVAVALGVAVNQVLNGGRWNVPWLVAAVVLAAIAETLDLWLGTRDSARGHGDAARPVLWPDLTGDDGLPLLLSEVTRRDLGVHPSRFGPDGDCPYIRREADGLLAAAFADAGKRVVIVEGPRLAGATSTLARAAQSCLPDYLAAGFIADPRVPLEGMITQAGQWTVAAQVRAAGAVVWLDGLSPSRLGELASMRLDDLPPRTWVLATLDTRELEGLRIPEQLNTLMGQHAIRVPLGAITGQELRDLLAETAYAPLRPVLEQGEELLLGRLMVAWEPVRAALDWADSEHAADRVALLHAVTDWYRVQLPRLLTHDVLRYLYRAYHHELTGATPDSPVSASGFSDALGWAATAAAACRPRLVDLQDVPGGQRYAPYPLLTVIADDPGEDVSWPVSDVLWSYVDHYFDGDQRRDIGYSALGRGASHAAARLLSHTDTTVDPAAHGQLALLFYQRAEWADSRHWLQQAVSTGHADSSPRAMVDLGILEKEQGHPGQARDWLQQAISTSHSEEAPRAMFNLGVLEEGQGDPGQARRWYQQAISTSHPHHAPAAMVNLGVLEEGQGDPGQARHWMQQAISTTSDADIAPVAMVNLGLLEEGQGDPGQARRWYQQAISTSHPDQAPAAMVNLGVLEYEQGDPDQARQWYQQAISTSHPEEAPRATVNLGVLEFKEGEPDRARQWYQQAISTSHPDHAPAAMFNLGLLEEGQGDSDRARQWYQQAISTRHPEEAPRAMCNLGQLEKTHGDIGPGRHWLQQAISTGHPEAAPAAMVNLGVLEEGQGDPGRARHWYQQAISTGHPEAITRAHQYLRALEQRERERQRGEEFGRYGYLAYTDPALMRQAHQSPETPAPDLEDETPAPDLED